MRKKALMRVALGLGTIIVVVFGFYLLGTFFSNSHTEHTHSALTGETSKNHSHIEDINIDMMTEYELDSFLSNENDISHLLILFEKADEYNKFKIASRVLELNNKKGIGLLISILQTGKLPFVKEEAYNKIKDFSHKDFGYDVTYEDEENQKAINRMIKWKDTL